ncbi:hypothetical protein E4U32_006271 [Claviceps aff. humidiphila group G2b]|nr:hypothetical protein E4U32_006271 [Claviceps aff. humidiphila group G2b]
MASVENSSCPPQKRTLKPPLPTSTHVESSKSKADVRHNLPANQPRVAVRNGSRQHRRRGTAIPRCQYPFKLSAMMVLQKPGIKRELLAADIRHRCRSRSSVFCTSDVSGVARMSSKRYWVNAKARYSILRRSNL